MPGGETIVGRLIVQEAGQKAASMTGSSVTGAGAGSKKATDALKSQKTQEGFAKKSLAAARGAPKMMHKVMKGAGISMGVSGLLKQSQIFTGVIGSIFQILGAFIDVILAPFIPLFIPAIRWLARQLPVVSKWAQSIAEPVKQKFNQVVDWFKKFKEDPKAALKDLWETVIGKIKDFFVKMFFKVGGMVQVKLFDFGTFLLKMISKIPGLGKLYNEEAKFKRETERQMLMRDVKTRTARHTLDPQEYADFMATLEKDPQNKRLQRQIDFRDLKEKQRRATNFQSSMGLTGYGNMADRSLMMTLAESQKALEAGHLTSAEYQRLNTTWNPTVANRQGENYGTSWRDSDVSKWQIFKEGTVRTVQELSGWDMALTAIFPPLGLTMLPQLLGNIQDIHGSVDGTP